MINPPELPINDEARNDAYIVKHRYACSCTSLYPGVP